MVDLKVETRIGILPFDAVVGFLDDETKIGTSPVEIVVIVETRIGTSPFVDETRVASDISSFGVFDEFVVDLNVDETRIGIWPFDAVVGFVVDINSGVPL